MKKLKIGMLWWVMLALPAGALDMVRDGRAVSEIVVAADAHEGVKRAAEEEKSSAQLSLWLLRPLKYPEKDELLCFNFLSASLKPLGSKREESSIKNAPALSVICLFLCVIIPRHLRLLPRGLLCSRLPEKRPIKAN